MCILIVKCKLIFNKKIKKNKVNNKEKKKKKKNNNNKTLLQVKVLSREM